MTIRLSAIAFASLSFAAAGADGFYLGATGGQLQVDENAPTFAVPAVMPPPILYPVCGGTATIQYNATMGIQTLSGDANAGLLTVGWRRGRFALELAQGPDVTLSELTTRAPSSITQPSCTTTPAITVSAFTGQQREYTLDSFTLAALYDHQLVQRLRVQFRLQVASWDSSLYQSFESLVYETSNGTNFTGTTIAGGSTRTDADGIDLGYGIGLAYPLGEHFDLRLMFQRQSYDEAVSSGLTLSATFTF